MSSAVSYSEACEILVWMGAAPHLVRSLRPIDGGTYGPVPFFVDWKGEETEVTLGLTGGVVTGLASIRIGERFSNDHDWIGEAEGSPLDALPDLAGQLLELSILSAAALA